jgi:hypothetical protein
MSHNCELNKPFGANGPAVEVCFEDDEGRLWVSNSEYSSQVNFCPVCGHMAKDVEQFKQTQAGGVLSAKRIDYRGNDE